MESPQRQTILQNPSLEKAVNVIKLGISRHRTVVIAGKCTVDYNGRASSTLKEGERLIILKPDGSALVHRPKDYSPINWQPSGSIFHTKIGKEGLVVRVFRSKERESMVITFLGLQMVSVLDLVDNGEFSLYATEKEMQEAILFKPDLLEPGFRPITKEMAVDPGFIDIIGYDADGTLTIVEIKRIKANKKAVEQLQKYMNVIDLDENRTVRSILVAPEINDNAEKLLKDLGYEFKALSPQECSEILKQKKGIPLTTFFEP
ncbi:endonuclease NucS [Thermoproteota archaeon]